MKNNPILKRRIALILFIVYVLAMLFILVIPNNYRRQNVLVGGLTWEMWIDYVKNNINPVPLRGLAEQLGNLFAGQNVVRELIYLIGNTVGFVPLGIFLPVLFVGQRKFPAFLITVLLAVAALEFMQVMTMRGSCDIDDLILNTVGACIGYWITRVFFKRYRGGIVNG